MSGCLSHASGRLIVIYDFTNSWEGNLDDSTIRLFHLKGRRRQGLRCFHAPDDTAHPFSVNRDDFDVVFTVERL